MADNNVYILNNMFTLKNLLLNFMQYSFICKMRFYFIPLYS